MTMGVAGIETKTMKEVGKPLVIAGGSRNLTLTMNVTPTDINGRSHETAMFPLYLPRCT